MDELIVKKSPKSSIAEAIRVIRTNIQFSLKLKKGKTILVTSSIQGEGKSFTSSNLAVSFAQKNLKVLLVDCDLRLGRLHKIFKASNKNGFSNLLISDYPEAYKYYVQDTKIENLYFIPRGIVPPNPSEVLDSENVKIFMKAVREDFDIIIFDGTPIKVVIVSSANYTKMNLLENTIKSLKNLDVDIAGVVVNKVQNRASSSYYGGYYGSGYVDDD